MTQLSLLCGTPGSSLLTLARELDQTPGSRVLFPWNLGAALETLAAATRQRALAWRGPLADDVDWIERSLALFAGQLVGALLERELVRRGEFEHFALGHFALARHGRRLGAALPEARFVLCGDDGRIAPGDRFASGASARELALAGLRWGQEWSASLAPLVHARDALGERLLLVSEEQLLQDPARVKSRLLGTSAAWISTRPWKREPLAGPALDGFACSRAAQRLQRALGHAAIEPSPAALEQPEFATALALEWIDEGDFERAGTLLAHQAGNASAPLAHARGLLALARGEREQAADAWLAAIALDPRQPEPWEQLFALRDEPRTLLLVARARRSEVLRVRCALARWLVARGLDPEAAELAATVEHQPWARA